jgi:hypothetical protein
VGREQQDERSQWHVPHRRVTCEQGCRERAQDQRGRQQSRGTRDARRELEPRAPARDPDRGQSEQRIQASARRRCAAHANARHATMKSAQVSGSGIVGTLPASGGVSPAFT